MISRRPYFVPLEEIDAKHKHALVAALLAIFLGVLGVHRFYLHRNKSGMAIILVNLLSFGLGLLITVPLVLSEGVYYAYPENKWHVRNKKVVAVKTQPNFKEQLSEANQKFAQEMHANNAQFRKNISDIFVQPKANVKPQTADLNIIEIGSSTPQPIPTPTAPTNSESWLRRLEIPYERQSMQIPQIKQETLKLYEAICTIVDHELQKDGNSLLKLKHELEQSGKYYGNILYTLYCVAEGEIEHHYSSTGYDNSFSYGILRSHTNDHYTELVNKYCESYVERLPVADEATRAAYHLTPNGLRPVWWDTDGFIRENHNLAPGQTKILDRTPYRSTIVLNIPEIRLLVIAQYLATMNGLRQHFEKPQEWPPKTAEYLKYLFGASSNYDPYDYASAWIAHYILKLCEQTIRQNIPYSRLLNTETEIAYIKKTVPPSEYEAILERATRPIKSFGVSKETTEALRKQSPQAWKRNVTELASAQPEQYAHILEQYRNDPDFINIAKQAVKHTAGYTTNRLIACYAYFATVGQEEIDKPTLRMLHEIVTHPVQQRVFMEVAQQKLAFNIELIRQLEVLTQPPVHSIKLDTRKIEAAQEAHEDALMRVAGYLGEDDSPETLDEVQPTPKNEISVDALFGVSTDEGPIDTPTLNGDQTDFLRLVVKSDYDLDVAQAESFVRTKHKLLGSYVQEINQQYYEILEDQLLRTVDDKITVEEIYHQQIEEII
jgi:hypothetical protein